MAGGRRGAGMEPFVVVFSRFQYIVHTMSVAAAARRRPILLVVC